MKHLKIGDNSPEWQGTSQSGQILKKSDFLGKKLALYFYPKDNTPACTNQACNLRDNYQDLKKAGIEIVGISADNEKMHEKFIEKFQLPFALISDENHEMLNLFGVWGEKKFMGRIYDGIHRTTFLVNEEGKIEQIIDKPKTKAHSEEILEFFDKK